MASVISSTMVLCQVNAHYLHHVDMHILEHSQRIIGFDIGYNKFFLDLLFDLKYYIAVPLCVKYGLHCNDIFDLCSHVINIP